MTLPFEDMSETAMFILESDPQTAGALAFTQMWAAIHTAGLSYEEIDTDLIGELALAVANTHRSPTDRARTYELVEAIKRDLDGDTLNIETWGDRL